MVDSTIMSPDQVELNMAGLLNLEVAKLRSMANTHYINGNYQKSFDVLVAMKMTSVHIINKEQRKELEEMERKLEIPLIKASYVGSLNIADSSTAKESIVIVKRILPLYNQRLMDVLHMHGLLGRFRKDASRMKI